MIIANKELSLKREQIIDNCLYIYEYLFINKEYNPLENVSYFIKIHVVIKETYFIESIKRNMINYCKKYMDYAKTKSTIPLLNTEFFNKYIFL